MKHDELQPQVSGPAVQTPAAYLRELFLERKQRNSRYSTRAFARDLGMSQTLISLVMNGKRPLTLKQATQIAVLLRFDQEQTVSFLESALLALPSSSKAAKRLRAAGPLGAEAGRLFKNYEADRFKAISQWHHVAILDLTTTRNFNNDPAWIARRLGINPIEAKDAIDRLVDLGLLERRLGKLHKAENKVWFATSRSEPAVRAFHKQMIGKALNHLEKSDDASFEARQISGVTMAISKATLPRAKELICKFQQELAGLMTAGDCDEVYQLNVQPVPLTQSVN